MGRGARPRAHALRFAAVAASALALLGVGSPGDLFFSDQDDDSSIPTCGGPCTHISSLDPATGTTTEIFENDGNIFIDLAGGADGAVAAVGQPLDLWVYFAPHPPPPPFFPSFVMPVTQRLALERDGDMLFDGPEGDGLYRYRPRFDTLERVSPGPVLDIAVGAADEIFVVNGAQTIESVDPGTGARTVVSSGGLLGSIRSIAAEATGDLVALDRSFGVVRIELPGGAQQLVSAGGGIEAGVAIAAAADGTLYVAHQRGPGITPDGEIIRVDPVTGSQSLQTVDRPLYNPTALAVLNCNEVDGACSVPPECTTDADCDDGLTCTGADVCVNGRCNGGVDPCGPFTPCAAAVDECVECISGPCSDGLFCNGVESCDDATFQCIPGSGSDPCPGQLCNETQDRCVECLSASDCSDDGLFCTGAPVCSPSGQCQPGADPCPGEVCDEATDSCVECVADADCDDGLFCNGTETCAGNACNGGTPPCAAPYTCDEGGDVCTPPLPGDFDLSGLRATRKVRLSSGAPIAVALTVKNAGGAAGVGEVTLRGVQNGSTVFSQVQLVTLDPGRRATLDFVFAPIATGDVTWTASVPDGNPDLDVLTDTSQVIP